jgi:hypothetical protein
MIDYVIILKNISISPITSYAYTQSSQEEVEVMQRDQRYKMSEGTNINQIDQMDEV